MSAIVQAYAADADSEPQSWRIAGRESWVQVPPAAGAPSASAAGVQLHDRQIRITGEGDDRYEHLVLRLSSSRIVDGSAEIDVPVDPRFQVLVIHDVHLTHGGDAPRAVAPEEIRRQLQVQPREAEPRKRALDPQLRVSLRIAPVQAGDLLDYDYTVHSFAARTPGAAVGHYAAQWAAGGDEPVRRERLRVTWPAGRDLRYRLIRGATAAAPQVVTGAGQLELQWQNLLPPPSEPDTPRWFERSGAVELSDFTDWPQVAAVLAGYFEPVQTAQPPAAAATPDRVLAALRQLQSQVRATNVPGDASYAPAAPAVVLQRGYGDSRDLARLFVSLLRRDAIDAQVALANSRGVLREDALPSPTGLDAALVVAHVGGTEYWLNPAAPGPAEALDTADPADLRFALLVAHTGGRLVALPRPAADSRVREVTQQFDLADGNARPATLTVITSFRGGWAQAVRAGLAAQSPAQLQLTQMQAVAQDYPNATLDGAVAVDDLPELKGVELRARFRLSRPLGEGADPHFNFFAEALADRVEPRDEATRRYPLGLPWPLEIRQHIAALLPAGLGVSGGSMVITNKAFHYERTVGLDHGALHIDHRYVTLEDHVDPADYPEFLRANAQVYQALGVRVQLAGLSSGRLLEWLTEHMFALAAIAAVLGLTAAGLLRLRRR